MDSCIDTSRPVVSVIMPCYNCGNKIDITLKSVSNQTAKNYELIIIEDASTDNTLQKIKSFEQQFTNILIIKNEKNLGVYDSIDLGVKSSQGKYICFLAAGDYYSSLFLEKAIKSFQEFNEAKIWCCDLNLFSANDKIASKQTNESSTYYSPQTVVTHFKTSPFWIHGMATVLEKEIYLAYGKFPKKLGPQADWFLFHLIALHEGIAYTPSQLAFMELDNTSYSRAVHLDRKKRNAGYWTVLHTLYNETSRPQARRFIESGLLTSISDTLFWKLIRQPKYWCLLKHSKSSTSERIFKSLTKKVCCK